MNKAQTYLPIRTVSLAFLILFVAIPAQAEHGHAEVRAVRGSASISTGNDIWTPLRVGISLGTGIKIRTDADSQVDIFLDQNGPVVRIAENTTIGLEKLNYQENAKETVIETRINLLAGRILGRVQEMAATSKYEIQTPVGRVDIRGTGYEVSADGSVQIGSGTANVVYSPPGKPAITNVVKVGQQFRPSSTATNGIEPLSAAMPPFKLLPTTPVGNDPFPAPTPQRKF